MKNLLFNISLCCLLTASNLFAQTPGIIVRPAGSNGPAVLDPNADAYTSKTTAGFGTDDILNSEIPYKIVPPVIAEPTGDLLRGPDGKYSDIVKTVDGSGFYLFNDGTNLLCRIRMGGIVSGSKGYSLLLDTDNKFGNTGATADPNYVPATTGVNGNPGFELEIVFESNFRIAVYNVDGTSTPVLVTFYPINANSQISVAASTDGGDADYFYDFYVPFSVLGISASTPIRVSATTVMSPQAAIGGPKSDIYGIAGNDYMTQWTTAISSQPSFTFNSLSSGGSGLGAICTDAPVLNGPVTPSATTVTGTWTKGTSSPLSTATITLYKGVTAIGTTTVSSGATWSISVSGLANADVITAKSQASGESMCLSSNAVTVSVCNSSNIPATPLLSCTSGSKGVGGTNFATGWTIHVDNITRSTAENSVANTGGFFGANTGTSPNITWQYSGGCSSGSPLTSGSYKIYYTDNTTGCNSQPAYFCAAGNGGNALGGSLAVPTITSPSNGVYTPATTSITGSITTGATLTLYINGIVAKTTTAAAGTFTFSGLTFLTGQQFYIVCELNSGTVGTSYCASQTAPATITCFTSAPVITTSSSNQLTTGVAITGTAAEPTGTIIKVYTSANTLVATTTVQSNGTWSTTNAGTTPAAYTAVAATSYYANAQNGSCGLSNNSATIATVSATSSARCGTITGPVTESATSVSGTLSGTTLAGTVVTLYADGNSVGTYTTANNAWGPITVNTTINNNVYAGATLTIGIAEPSKNEVICVTQLTVTCTTPTAPAASPVSTTIAVGQTVTYTIASSQSGILYSLRDNADAIDIGESKFGTGGTITLVSNPFNTAGTIPVNAKATSFSGANCLSLSAASVIVTTPLPVSLVNFQGRYNNQSAILSWITASEINLKNFELQKSYTGNQFSAIATIASSGNTQLTHNYGFTDASIHSNVVYYRLKMVDNDNVTARYSKVIVLHADKGIMVNNISPNPFASTIKINVNAAKEAKLDISLNDLSGRRIKTIHYIAKEGVNNITMSGLSGLAKGAYIVELNSANENISRQMLIKQ
ncbi:T9SS type A sorting domain-containing protein [Ferruginibacter paludis]|uniref:T9SS type A sorting domain-containing protein n=1 Tax=Ferruginibacter paludis TaxID=1310417 RepID=UPI0025B60001|nr:T9SS type A sorting domain-containing protein [Ferruginibacter paludis]MDN3657531.1 T9SS type A sorting domain-containing protein [Ferruginibacter paludis]